MGNANPANTTILRWLSLLIISLLSRPADAQSGNGDYDTYTTWSEFVTEYLEQNIDEDALEAESDLRKTCNLWKTFISVLKTSTPPQKKIFSVLRS